jgi:O-succinylbenzoic acid--CoA ligase
VDRDWLATAATTSPERPFLHAPDRIIPFGEFDEEVRRATGALIEAGVGPGDRVAVLAEGDVRTAVALFAVPRAGAVFVPISPRLTEAETDELLRLVAARAAIGPVRGALRRIDDLDGPPRPGVGVDADRDHSIVFTSGSGGRPKGVRLTWRNLEAAAAASAAHLRHTESDRWLAVLPLSHVGGMSILIRSARQRAAVALEPSFSADRVAGMLTNGEATLASLVAVMLRRVLDADPGPYRGVRAVLLGGGPTPRDLLEDAADAGLPVLPTYGMTETAAQVATAPLDDGLHPGTRLRPLPGVELDVGADGRIRVRGDMVSPGDVGGPERAPGDWYVTGDVGDLDHRGLVVLGRADDVIVTGGENVHPLEVESVLASHPGVNDVVVVGVPDPRWGALVCAVWEGTAAPGDLERLARLRLAGFKIPRRWLRVEHLPRVGIDKPDRRAVELMAERG